MPKRILVVDDSPSIRSLIRVFLLSQGHEFIEADSGERALSVMRIVPADLVVVDVHMPGMGGVEFVRKVRAHPKPHVRNARLLLLSGETDESVRTEGLSAGADAFMSKPVTSDRLNDQVAILLGGTRP